MGQPMPKIILHNLDLTADEYRLARGIINLRTGELRASKPPVPRKVQVGERDRFGIRRYDYADEAGANAGRTAYIWRMVAFMVSPIAAHHCMPVTAEFDLPGDFDASRKEAKELDKVVSKIVDNIPAHEWHGVRRWGKALGYGG
jgi:hypothetical protein